MKIIHKNLIEGIFTYGKPIPNLYYHIRDRQVMGETGTAVITLSNMFITTNLPIISKFHSPVKCEYWGYKALLEYEDKYL